MKKWITLPVGIMLLVGAYLYQRWDDSDRVLAVALQIPDGLQLEPGEREVLLELIREAHPAAMTSARGGQTEGSRFDSALYKRALFSDIAAPLPRPGRENLAAQWKEAEETIDFTVEERD